jgi:hypothetical protein
MKYSAPDIEPDKGTARDGGVVFLETIDELEFIRHLMREFIRTADHRLDTLRRKAIVNPEDSRVIALAEADRLAALQDKAQDYLVELDGDIEPTEDSPSEKAARFHSLRLAAENVRLQSMADTLTTEIAKLNTNGVPGVMHEADRAFYALLLQERDYYKYLARNLVNPDGSPKR